MELIASVLVMSLSLLCAAQTGEVNSDKIMDAALELKKAAMRADELATDGRKYCDWGRPRLDTADLGDAIFRHLLNHGSRVPEHIAASKMWRVSFVAADLVRELDSLGSFCATSNSREAGNLYQDSLSFAKRFQESRVEFTQLAALQTLWQERDNLDRLRKGEQNERDILRSQLHNVLVAAREMKESAEWASQVSSQESRRKSDCRTDELPSPYLKSLDVVINDIEREPDDHFLLASEVVPAQLDIESSEMIFVAAEHLCLQRVVEKKKARRAAIEMSKAHVRLMRSIGEFESLLVRQCDWEESILEEQVVGQEQ